MSLTHTDILEIINACKGHVKSLKIKGGSIEVEFIVPHQPANDTPSTHNQGSEKIETRMTEIQEEDLAEIDFVEPISDKVMSLDEQMDELNIANPLLAEDMIVQNEVVSAEAN